MTFADSGYLTTDIRDVDDTTKWDSQTEWNQYRDKDLVEIDNGKLKLGNAPPNTSSLIGWYDATELNLSDGDDVNSWPDRSGEGNDFSVGGTAPDYKTGQVNSNPVVRFDGSNDWMTSDLTASQAISIFAVFRWVTVNSGGTNTYAWYDDSNSFKLQDTGNGEDQMEAGVQLKSGNIDSNYHIYGCIYQSTNSKFRKDGSEKANGDAGTNDLSNGFRIAADNGGGSNANVDFGEILVYPSDQSSSASDIETYLDDKWGPII